MHKINSRLIILRHAERPEIIDGSVGNEISLTEKGILQSKKFAREMQTKVVSVRTSPVLRCMQTAQIMADEWGYPRSEIVPCSKLGDPGFFIEDAELAWQNWLEKGADEVNQHLLTGADRWPGFVDFKQAISDIETRIKFSLNDGPVGLSIWVTHDTILAALAGRLLPSAITMSEWPDFLGRLEASINFHGDLEFAYIPVPETITDG